MSKDIAALRRRLMNLRRDALRQLAEADTINLDLVRRLVDANAGLRVLAERAAVSSSNQRGRGGSISGTEGRQNRPGPFCIRN
jgi:hypothetical protein